MYVIFSSYGNDSVALIQHAHELGLMDVHVAYSDTGWAARWWKERVEKAEAWVASLGFTAHRLPSIGLEQLVRDRKGWPRQGMQFCTLELKIRPAMEWLDTVDPDRTAVCMVGVRREESRSRADWPEWQDSSPNHGGRPLNAALALFTKAERDALIAKTPFEILPHRSMECFPCINSNRTDLRLLDEDRVAEIEKIEESLGHTSKGKPRTMFRPYRHMGATGIREVVRWAQSERGEFSLDDGGGAECESGYCGL